MSTLVGKMIGKYKITERLGRGGMAEVYKAHHPKLDRTVTIKVLHGYLAEGEDFLARFEREAKAVATLRHPHIVQIHDFDAEDDTYYMVMEFVDGGTLQARMGELSKRGTYMPVKQVLSILHNVAEALDYAHQRGIIHRDVKPSNILLDSSGQAFLADFGIARMISTTQFTTTGALIGTPTYMSPEQGKGLELTAVSDIYSLGVILYELLTGRAPYQADTPLALIQKHVSEPLVSPGLLRPGLPSAVEAVIEKALSKEPAQRYARALDMIRALEKALPEEVIDKLDATAARPRSAAVLPTVRMESEVLPGRAQQPTEALSAETSAEIIKEPEAARTAQPKPIKPSAEIKKTTKETERKQPAKVSKKPASPALIDRFKSKPVLYAIIGLVVVVILLVVLSSLSVGTGCANVDECIFAAEDLNRQGNVEGALEAYSRAADMVIPELHHDYAWLWCTRADLLDSVGRFDEATANREMCASWESFK